MLLDQNPGLQRRFGLDFAFHFTDFRYVEVLSGLAADPHATHAQRSTVNLSPR